MPDVLIFITILLTALSVGIFFGFAVAVNGGLGKLDDSGYLLAMQQINRVILNPLFLSVFLLPVVLLPVVTFLHGGMVDSVRFWLFSAASLAYFFGMFGITVAGNVPLNNWLDKIDLTKASRSELGTIRARYQRPWNRLHTLRTIIGCGALALLIWASLI